MDNTVIITLITIGVPAFLVSLVSPIVIAVIQAKNKRLEAELAVKLHQAEREEEWRREDILEKRATERAELVARYAVETSEKLISATVEVRDLSNNINGKVDEVHALVNSSYTAALQAALEAVQAKLVVLLDSTAFKVEHKMEVSPEITADIIATKIKMQELSDAIGERMRQDALAKEAKAKSILIGKQQQTTTATKDQPLPVADNRTATATERTATASERVADAAERSADAANTIIKK